MEKMSAADLERGLAGFCGTENWHRHFLGLYFTDGVKFLADNAGAYWLIDLVASYIPKCRKDAMLRDIQFWRLQVHNPPLVKKGVQYMATAYCARDTGNTAFSQDIPFTDFPLPEIKLYCELGSVDGEHPCYVLMLVGER